MAPIDNRRLKTAIKKVRNCTDAITSLAAENDGTKVREMDQWKYDLEANWLAFCRALEMYEEADVDENAVPDPVFQSCHLDLGKEKNEAKATADNWIEAQREAKDQRRRAAEAAAQTIEDDRQYEAAKRERGIVLAHVDQLVDEVAEYLSVQREETSQSLQIQNELLTKAEEQLIAAQSITAEMGRLKPDKAAEDSAEEGRKRLEVLKHIRTHRGAISKCKVAETLVELQTGTSARSFAGSRGGDGNYMFKRRDLPSFNGAKRDYPSFRREWKGNVSGNFTTEYELREIKMNVPSEVEPDLKNLKSMEAVWEVLDRKYGQTMELASELICGIQKFKYSNKAKTESAQFAELDREWTKVYNDLEEVGKLDVLNHEPTLNGIAQMIPGDLAKKAYVQLRLKMRQEYEQRDPPEVLSELEVMRVFMRQEREQQQLFAALVPEGADRTKEARQPGGGPGGRRNDLCYECGKPGHRRSQCPGVSSGRAHATQDSGLPCPACEQIHTFKGRDGTERTSKRLGAFCAKFKQMNVEARVALFQKIKGCANCLDFTGKHQRDSCPSKKSDGSQWCCDKSVDGVACGKKHHWMLHGTTNKFANYVQVNRAHVSRAPTEKEIEASQNSATLMLLQRIPVKGAPADCLTFFDNGSNINLIRRGFAEKAGLKGTPRGLELSTTGDQSNIVESKAYWVPLIDRAGLAHNLLAFEMESITAPMEAEDVTAAEQLFPEVEKGALQRPGGSVDLLVGMQMASLFPQLADRDKHLKGNLMLMTSIFGTGYVLAGDHKDIKANVVMQSPESRAASKAMMVSYTKGAEGRKQAGMSHRVARRAVFQFPECEELGVGQPRRCGSCKTCVRCSNAAVTMTRREQEELALVEESITLDVDKQKVSFHYPLIKDPRLLTDNRDQVEHIARALERKLMKNGKLADYNKAMQEFVDRGVFVRLSEEEMQAWKAQGRPVNYISHQGVYKESSATTKLRVVSNSSLENNKVNRLSYNDLLPKGPNSLEPLLVALVQWRAYKHCCVWDLTKAYNTVKTFEEEKHMRRLVWRWGDTSSPWTVYGIDAMHFGDRCATCGLKVALCRVAEAGERIDPAAAKMIKQGYVDDGIGGGSREDVDRMVGKEAWIGGMPTYDGTVAKILELGGFKVKVMVRDGESRPEVNELLGGGVLGLPWVPEADVIEMHLGVNLSEKKKGARTGPELTPNTVSEVDTARLTRRELVSQIYSIYDPLGLLAPIVIKFKLLLQELAAAGGDWDDELDGELAGRAREVLKAMVLAEDVTFPRSIVPDGVDEGTLELCGWWDGGKPASSACLYARFEKEERDENGTHSLRLLMGKARVTPSAKDSEKLRRSTPRTEMRGLTMLTRMTTAVLPGLTTCPVRVSLMGDSECTISAVDCLDGQLDIWFANRVAEVLEHMEAWRKMGIQVDELHHWPGSKNIADLATKGKAELADVEVGSEWQDGPLDARFPRDSWPATRDFKRDVPEGERRVKNFAAHFTKVTRRLRVYELAEEIMERSRTFDQARGIVARWLRSKVAGDRHMIERNLLAKDLKLADDLLYLAGTADTLTEMAKGSKSRLMGLAPQWSKGRFVTRGRLGKGMLRILGVTELAILMPTSQLARLVMQQAHNEDHKGSTITLWRSRARAWIWRGRFLAERICKECTRCVANRALTQQQRMGALPLERTAAGTLPFTYICLDLMGAFLVKDMVKKRCTMKVFPMVFVCQATGALHTGVMHDYSTSALLLQWDYFVAIRGVPALVVSDRGSQLTSSGNTIAWGGDAKQDGTRVWDEVEAAGARRGTRWQFVPAGAQFRNGLSEARVKAVKSTLRHMLATTMAGDKPTLSYAELVTVLAQAANIVNDRPIWARVLTEGDVVPLTVNQLLLGRTSTTSMEARELGEEGEYKVSSKHVDHLLDTWWSLWRQQGFASLLPYNKIKDGKRHTNLQEGDVCLLQYENKVKNTYRLCRVIAVKKSEDGLVRTVTVAYKARRTGKLLPHVSSPLTTMDVAIQRLVLLVPKEKAADEVEEVLLAE